MRPVALGVIYQIMGKCGFWTFSQPKKLKKSEFLKAQSGLRFRFRLVSLVSSLNFPSKAQILNFEFSTFLNFSKWLYQCISEF
jgi:hypothetical protein